MIKDTTKSKKFFQLLRDFVYLVYTNGDCTISIPRNELQQLGINNEEELREEIIRAQEYEKEVNILTERYSYPTYWLDQHYDIYNTEAFIDNQYIILYVVEGLNDFRNIIKK